MRAIRRIRLFGVFVLVTLAAGLIMWYVTFTSQRERDLTRTNLRILNRVAYQLDRTIDGQEGAFSRLAPVGKGSWLDAARGQIPSLKFVRNNDIKESTEALSPAVPRRRHQVTIDGREARLTFTLSSQEPVFQRTISMDLGSLITPVLAPLLRARNFVAVAVATEDGRVLHAVGDRSSELLMTRLDKLAVVSQRGFLLASTPQTPVPNPFATSTSTAGAVDVVLLGTEHKLFTHPCCPLTTVQSQSGAASPAPTSTASRLVLVGIADAAQFRAELHEISPTLVFSGVASILLVLAAWPFLKLRLIGDRQRVRRRDVAAVVGCGTFGLALLTTVFLDVYAYTWFQHVRDRQLKAFAATLSVRANTELRRAYSQLRCLKEAALSTMPRDEVPRTRIFDPSPGHASPDCDEYPLFETFALINDSGFQTVKWSAQRWVPEFLDVSRRAYVTDILEDRPWRQRPECLMQDCVVESIWSNTTMKPEAVVSMPASSRDRPELRVAALAFPMHALVDSVVPQGFEFVVVNNEGLVLFHSDSQRNTFENLFRETNHDRRLRAAVSGRSDETFGLQYAGRSYRAYVSRLGLGDWSIVTMSPNERVWAMHTEWLVIWLAAMATHMLLFTLLFVAALWGRDSSWLWWNPGQASRYRILAGVMLGFLIAGVVVLYAADDGWLIVLASALPLTAWLTTLLVLRRHPPATDEGLKGQAGYTITAVLLLLLTSVIPASGFFLAAYDVQMRSHVKHALVELVRDFDDTLAARGRRYQPREWPGVKEIDRHREAGLPKVPEFSFQFATRRLDATSADECPASDGGSPFTWFLEDVLPYYSEYSVHSRQFLHDQAGDAAWRWKREGTRLSLCLKATNYRASMASTMPALRDALLTRQSDSSSPNAAEPVESVGVWLLRASLSFTALGGLVLLTWLFFRFIKTHICLIDVDQPLWSGSRLPFSSGENLFVVCDRTDNAHLVEGTHPVSLHDIAHSTNPDQEWLRTLSQLDIQPPGRPVRVSDFVDQLEDPALTHRKLGWIEALAFDRTRSLIILSPTGPRMIDHTLRMRFADGSAADPQLLERWRLLLASFVVVDWRNEGRRSGDVRVLEHVVRSEGDSRLSDPKDETAAQVTGRGREALRAEAAADAFVHAICTSIEHSSNRRRHDPPDRRDPQGCHDAPPHPEKRKGQRRKEHVFRLTPAQVFDEVSERTTAWYSAIWSACSQDEKLTLADIADDGFVNYKKRRTVRRLLARGLVVRDPSFRLMNETFRRFVFSAECRMEVREIEGAAEPSPWDALRLPFFVVLFGAGLFFVSTQRELFNASVAALTALAGAVPVLFRAIGMMGGKAESPGKQNA